LVGLHGVLAAEGQHRAGRRRKVLEMEGRVRALVAVLRGGRAAGPAGRPTGGGAVAGSKHCPWVSPWRRHEHRKTGGVEPLRGARRLVVATCLRALWHGRGTALGRGRPRAG